MRKLLLAAGVILALWSPVPAATAATVSITATAGFASEAGLAQGAYRISRTGLTTLPLLVNIQVFGTATRNIDYALSVGSLAFSGNVVVIPPGASAVTLTLTPKQDSQIEGNETAIIRIAPSAAYTVGAQNQASVVISDNDLPAGKPNIVVIMTDDQTVADLQVMSKTRSLLGDRGVTFTNSFVDYSLCCPSRATFMTGQAAHNHHVLGNTYLQDGGYQAFKPTEGNALPVWLKTGGYKTFAFTKLMNGYGGESPAAPLAERTHIPPGWDQWYGRPDYTAYHYYDYDLNENGNIVRHGCLAEDYETDLMAKKAAAFIAQNRTSSQPFFMWLAPLAPHDSFDRACGYTDTPMPAARHLHHFDNLAVPHGLNFNEADVSDKPNYVFSVPLLAPGVPETLDVQVRRRRETLLAVDEMVEKVVNALFATGKLNNTYIIFTSDNGFLMGEHRLKHLKTVPYEESIRVPLIIRGPGIPANQKRAQLVNNVDVVATIVQAAGVTAGRTLDGRSLIPLMQDVSTPWRSTLLIQGVLPPYGSPVIRFQGVRTALAKYIEIAPTVLHPTGEQELYNLWLDPRELQNIAGSDAALKAALQSKLNVLRTCAGATCWMTDP